MALTRPRYSNIVDTDYKNSCRVVTTTDITLSGGAPSTYDSVSLAAGDRILVTAQGTGSQNGIYIVSVLGTGSNGTWIRAMDASDGTRLTAGAQVSISDGTYASQSWRLTTPDPITIGSTSLTWIPGAGVPGGTNTQIQFNNSGTLYGAAGLTYDSITGNTAASLLYASTLKISSLQWASNSSPILAGATQDAFYISRATIGVANVLIDTLPVSGNTSLRWTISSKDTINNRFRQATIDSVNDGTTVYYTEYAQIRSHTSYPVATFISNISNGNINLYAAGDSTAVTITFQRLVIGTNSPLGYSNEVVGVGPKGDIAATTGIIQTSNTTQSTSTVTGALLVPGGVGIGGNIYAGGNIIVGNDLYVAGNLNLSGALNEISATVLNISDLQITLANGAATAGAADTAGIVVAGAGATITYSSANDAWTTNKDMRVTGTVRTSGGVVWSGNSLPVRNGINYTAAATAPVTPNYGDQWYDTATDVLYEWATGDGSKGFWVDISSPIIGTPVSIPDTLVTSNLIPSTNLTYNLGSTSARFANIYVGNVSTSGNIAIDGGQMTLYDSIIDLHTYGNLATWGIDDGKDIGMRMHYYNAADKLAFMGLENSTKTLQFLIDATEVSSNVTGTYGNVRFGSLFLSNTTSSADNTSGALVVGGGVGITGNINLVYNPLTTIGSAIQLTGKDTQGGTGYFDFLKSTNTTSGATNPNKTFRLNSTGGVEIINSAYTSTLFSLSDAGAMNISGSYQVSGKKAVNGPAFGAYAEATLQTITSGSQTKVLFQTEEFDTDGCFASSRFTPNVEGYYQLNAEVRLDGSSGTGEIMIVLYKNTSEHKRGTNQSGSSIGTNFFAMTVSALVYANGTTDYFEIKVQQTSGGSMTVTAVNNPAITWFNGAMVRGA